MVAPWDTNAEKSRDIIDNLYTIKDINEFLRSKGLSNIERTGVIAKIKQTTLDNRKGNATEGDSCNTESLKAMSNLMSDLRVIVTKI